MASEWAIYAADETGRRSYLCSGDVATSIKWKPYRGNAKRYGSEEAARKIVALMHAPAWASGGIDVEEITGARSTGT